MLNVCVEYKGSAFAARPLVFNAHCTHTQLGQCLAAPAVALRLLNNRIHTQVKPFTSRTKFSPKHFAEQYDLGDPLATFYFKAEAQAFIDESK